MSINPIIFFDLVITIFILALALIIIIFLLLRSIRKIHLYEIENINSKSDDSSLLGEARNKAARITDQANNKALDIIQKANLFVNVKNDDFNKELKSVTQKELKAFDKTTSDFIKVYENVLNDLKTRNVEIFQNISNNIETSTLGEIKKFNSAIEQEAISDQKMLVKKIDDEYSLAKKDIDAYRQTKLRIMDERIFEILEKVSRLVLGKAISPSDHEALIIDSLEKAKKEAVFDNAK